MNINTMPFRWHLIKYPPVTRHFTHSKCLTPHSILGYNLPANMILLNPVLKKLRIQSPAECYVSKQDHPPAMKRNNTEFTNLSRFTSLLIRRMHFTVSWSKLLALTISNSFVHFVFDEIPVQSAWEVPVRPQPFGDGCSSGHFNLSELDSTGFQISEIQDLPTSSKKFLSVHSFFVFCTQKCTSVCTV